MTAERLRNYVNGEWVSARTERCQPVHNPATEAVLAEVPLGSAADLDHAVRAAHAAFADWRKVPPVERANAQLNSAVRAPPT